jgi:integrase
MAYNMVLTVKNDKGIVWQMLRMRDGGDSSSQPPCLGELLGHKNVETTMIYTHVLRIMSKAPESPLDLLLRQEEGQPES